MVNAKKMYVVDWWGGVSDWWETVVGPTLLAEFFHRQPHEFYVSDVGVIVPADLSVDRVQEAFDAFYPLFRGHVMDGDEK